jgi:acyl-CoA synthetase (AMP-forming)/AMP-acid ligase II
VSEPRCEGEILIGGAQVMNGYLHRADEDALVFTELDGERYYRSGDLGFWDEQGLLHYVGRRDGEVKIDGVRTHLNEVQRALHEAEGVEALVVGVLSTQGTKELVCAWTGSSASTTRTLHALLSRAESQLPRAMRPSRWVRLERIPQLSSGKADVAGVLTRVAAAIDQVGGFAFEERARGLTCVSLEARPC